MEVLGSIGWIFALLLVAYITVAPIDECSKCTHCIGIRLQKKQKQKDLNNEYAHKMGLINPDECRCSRCKDKMK